MLHKKVTHSPRAVLTPPRLLPPAERFTASSKQKKSRNSAPHALRIFSDSGVPPTEKAIETSSRRVPVPPRSPGADAHNTGMCLTYLLLLPGAREAGRRKGRSPGCPTAPGSWCASFAAGRDGVGQDGAG